MDYTFFINNKYTRWYISIVEKAKHRKLPKSETELHHILPKSIFPEYKNLKSYPENGVRLTFREHYICHWLLTKMVTDKHLYTMSAALSRMTKGSKNRYRPKSIIYENTKQKVRKNISGKNSPLYGIPKTYPIWNKGKQMKEETKQKIREYNLGKKHTLETKRKMSESRLGCNNPRFTGFYVTPWGKFSTIQDAVTEKVTPHMIKTWCKYPTTTITINHVRKSLFLNDNHIGKTFADLGFGKE